MNTDQCSTQHNEDNLNMELVGSSGYAVERQSSVERTVVQSYLPPFQNLGNFIHTTFVCVFRKTLKAGGPFYLVSMRG